MISSEALTDTPTAHLELILMDSRVAASPKEYFLDRFRRRDLLEADLLSGIDLFLQETRVCGGKVIYLGKIVVEEWLQFIERTPELAAGLQLQVAIRFLAESTPFLAPVLTPLRAAVDAQAYGEAFRGTGFITHLSRDAEIYFKKLANILNLTSGFLRDGSGEAFTENFETPDLFALDNSEDPFDLDDLSKLSPITRAAAKFLIVLALAEGGFCDAEQFFLRRMLGEVGESLSPSQFQRLANEASQESPEEILRPVEHKSPVWKEKLLMSGMLMGAADGKVDLIEKKLLAQARLVLGISTTRYKQIAADAVSIIKSFRTVAVPTNTRIGSSVSGQACLLPEVGSWETFPGPTTNRIEQTAEEVIIAEPSSPEQDTIETIEVLEMQPADTTVQKGDFPTKPENPGPVLESYRPKFCGQCGEALQPTYKFCKSCGTRVM
jgi:hypothetical protein